MDQDATLVRDERALWRVDAAGAVTVLGPRDDEPRLLLGSGSDLWSELAVPATLRDVAGRLSGRFGVDYDEVRRALEPVVEELVESEAIRIV